MKLKAFYRGNGKCELHCKSCQTYESGFELSKIHDHALKHLMFWHGGKWRIPREM